MKFFSLRVVGFVPSRITKSSMSSNIHNAAGEQVVVVDPKRAAELVENLKAVKQAIHDAGIKAGRKDISRIRLVAVSKLKPASDIKALYDAGQRHFGENYVQEMEEKAKILPQDIQWHFIGGLQSNKCKELAESIPNLYAVETVDSEKKARKLNEHRSKNLAKLNIFIQVNTSNEAQKSGIHPSQAVELAKYITSDCPQLQFCGLMTIGSFTRSLEANQNGNQDFTVLYNIRHDVANALNIDPTSLQLSMGMSKDYRDAVIQGSTNVRVGSDIFGARPPKDQAKII